MTAAVTFVRHGWNDDSDYWEARREGQAAPVGYGGEQHEALEALLCAEHREATT